MKAVSLLIASLHFYLLSFSNSFIAKPGPFSLHPTSPSYFDNDTPFAPYRKRCKVGCKKVLLVDDEESIRKAVGDLLRERKYKVSTCEDGQEALDYLKSHAISTQDDERPDVVVSDVRMPNMDGLSLLNHIRSDPDLVEMPVILLTAKALVQDRIAGYDSGADAYIPKPFDPEELIILIENIVQRNKLLTRKIDVLELQQDLEEIKKMIYADVTGPGNGYVPGTDVFLAPDERKILSLVCEGLMNKEIGQKMFLSTKRVEAILTTLYKKTKTRNRTELLRWAVSTGLVDI